MLIYKINFSLLNYIFWGRGLKGCAGCRQTEVQTNKQTISASYAKELANTHTHTEESERQSALVT